MDHAPSRGCPVSLIPRRPVGSTQPPKTFGISPVLPRLIFTKRLVGKRRMNRVFKIIREPVIFVFQIQPDMRILVRKKRRHLNQPVIPVTADRTSNRFPDFRGQRFPRGADRKHIQKKRLVKMVPPQAAKPAFGGPCEREGLPLIRHPREIDSLVKTLRQITESRIPVILRGKNGPRNEKRRINRGQFGFSRTFPGFRIKKMIKKSPLLVSVI